MCLSWLNSLEVGCIQRESHDTWFTIHWLLFCEFGVCSESLHSCVADSHVWYREVVRELVRAKRGLFCLFLLSTLIFKAFTLSYSLLSSPNSGILIQEIGRRIPINVQTCFSLLVRPPEPMKNWSNVSDKVQKVSLMVSSF